MRNNLCATFYISAFRLPIGRLRAAMPLQLALTLTAASVGFVSAGFFSFGAISMGPEEICLQATPFWDFSEPVARALSAQRAQNIVGATLLVIAFCLQVAAVVVPPNIPSPLPQRLQDWRCLVLVVFLIATPTGYAVSLVLESLAIEKALALSKQSKSSPSLENKLLCRT